ncbi:hypothetical protein OPKNFCMD_3966 [Methylobacterium crusticola]|uniref:CYTH and CHAD domain-containing protein n=1 Tax=Methylobacterium crusticola TaxID=1697972 RepID=A0ABQ4R2X0_9HYPH|nr:CHAD domain-containing protein [Methylobacterium crusticola]GJD51214.1 hypothetical protein OPKNFCMD_3966 [Methylobacterium crusticola]
MSEPREIELKLACGAGDLAALQDYPRLSSAAVQDEAQLSSVYFDTADALLRRAGYVLRVRTAQGRHVQTVKAAGDGLFERPEWEQVIGGPEPDREALRGTPVAKLLGRKARLEPLFTVSVARRTYEVEQGHSRIEVALDRGHIAAPAADAPDLPVSEVELELIEGSAADLFVLAHAISSHVPVRLGVRSKAERGFALRDGERPGTRKAEPVVLRPEMTAADAFRAVAHACLRHMRLNEDLLLEHRDVDALHQARVAIRRLRSAFSLFGGLIRDVHSGGTRAELKRLSEPLGRARNLDVFLGKTLPAERARHPDEQSLLNLEKQLEAQRSDAYAAVEALLRGEEWRRFLIDLVAWINSGPWLTVDDGPLARQRDQPARAFAAQVLEKRRRQVKKRGRDLAGLSPEDRHQVRIAAKKLRYGAEFFGSLYADKKEAKRHRRFVAALADLQDALGDLNDIATGHEIVGDVSAAGRGGGSALFAAGMTAADIEARTGALLEDAAEAYDALIDVRPFWR